MKVAEIEYEIREKVETLIFAKMTEEGKFETTQEEILHEVYTLWGEHAELLALTILRELEEDW